jgi:2-keto-4-pentenoate hydratase
MTDTPDTIARRIATAHRVREQFIPLDAAYTGDLGFAYAVQEQLITGWQSGGSGKIAGWKVGLTAARMQAMVGVNEPISGAIFAERQLASGAVLHRSQFVRLGIEAEIAVCIGDPFPEETELHPPEVLRRLRYASAAYEIIEDRNADYSRLDAASLIADNSWNHGMVLGAPTLAARLGVLTGRKGVLTINDRVSDQGMSDDIGGDPLRIVGWLGAHLARRGRPLLPGQWVLTGSLVTTKFPEPGDELRFAVEGLETVVVRIAQ